MKKLIVIAILLMFVVPVMAQDKPSPCEDQLTRAVQIALNWKEKYGAEVQTSAHLQRALIAQEDLNAKLKAEIKDLKSKEKPIADATEPKK